MKYVIDETVAEKMNLNLPQMLLLMFIKSNSDIRWVLGELLEKGAIVQIGTPPNRYMLLKSGILCVTMCFVYLIKVFLLMKNWLL